jgi:hypothetical protein
MNRIYAAFPPSNLSRSGILLHHWASYYRPAEILYFQNTWEEDLTEPERTLILAYLRTNGNIDPVVNKEVLYGLVQNDIFEINEGGHVFVIDLFKRWILKNLPV